MKKIVILIVLILAISSSLFVYFKTYPTRELPTLPVEEFIRDHFIQKNSLLLTTIGGNPSIEPWAAGDNEALSESLGLWLQYLFLVEDKMDFKKNINVLNIHYLSPESLVYWKLDDNGKTLVETNALLDDLRIFKVIDSAAEEWNQHSYNKLADKLADGISNYSQNNQYLVDFYDRQYDEHANVITLAYIDVEALIKLEKRIGNNDVIGNTLTILIEAEDTPFFPKKYTTERGYVQEEDVLMIEQLYTALHKLELGHHSPSFDSFIKSELENGRLYGRYYVDTLKASVPFESASVYALTVLYALKINDDSLAVSAFEKMKSLQTKDEDSIYFGGYVDEENDQTHIFDNLLPLLAERSFMDAQLAR